MCEIMTSYTDVICFDFWTI